ncbi:AAA family ATPase [Natrinema thermotolerans]|uniref:AAA family ATPase n=1 Tax=Natrinema thermotolerans TaxID=121872 RepID=A0AAF0P9K8_9EURY|nr:AAA family ATPase [Natrinema thermotolerans]QCC59920.1 hypothetical protein DVR14_15315 [Natrinema thermotolerans]WMT06921.1 AAA family ATPase [Natrinema thermotolerans]
MLKSTKVQNYRSIVDSGTVELNQKMTTIVGGNEAGKTNFLKSLTLLGDPNEIPREKLCDYNSEKITSKKMGDIQVLEVELPSQSLASDSNAHLFHRRRYVREEGSNDAYFIEPSESDGSLATVKRYADGTHKATFNDQEVEKRYLTSLLTSRTQQLGNQITVEQISSELGMRIRRLRRTPFEEDAETDFQDSLDDLQNYIRENNEVIAGQYDEEESAGSHNAEKLISEIIGIIESSREESGIRIYESDLRHLPDIHYYGEIDEIKDEVAIEELRENPEENAAYSAILSYAGLEPEELDDLSSGEIRDRRQRAGEEFSDLFNQYWNQSTIDIEIELSGGRVSLQFYDESNKRKAASDRSRGLRRFVSFLAQVISQSDSQLENSIVLLDSPGVHLHPEGHRNLRNSLSRLAESNQLIFATHAPYMIDTQNLTRIRVARRPGDGSGTKVQKLGHQETPSDDSLASVRASLGATFSDSLFSSSKTVLVEGFEDRLYLNSFSKLFDKLNDGESFHPNIQIIDCGGATKTTYMGRLVDAENYEYAVFLDGDEEGRVANDQLIEDGVPSKHVLTVSDILTTDAEVTVEDLFSREFSSKITAEVHGLSLDDIEEEFYNSDKSVVESLNGEIKRIQGISDGGLVVKKKEIAKRISEKILEKDDIDLDDETIDNFSNLISEINRIVADEDDISSGEQTGEGEEDEETRTELENEE